MTAKAKQPDTSCAVCGGDLHATTITHEERRDEHFYLFQNVPVQVCNVCGEQWIAEEVLQQIDRLITDGVPVRTVETPVYDYPHASSAAG